MRTCVFVMRVYPSPRCAPGKPPRVRACTAPSSLIHSGLVLATAMPSRTPGYPLSLPDLRHAPVSPRHEPIDSKEQDRDRFGQRSFTKPSGTIRNNFTTFSVHPRQQTAHPPQQQTCKRSKKKFPDNACNWKPCDRGLVQIATYPRFEFVAK